MRAALFVCIQKKRSALADFAFFMDFVRAARLAELLDAEFLSHRALVLRRVVVRTAAGFTRQFDEVTHGLLLAKSRNGMVIVAI